jgi:hypothetical protein
VRWRLGLVQATARYPGHEAGIHRPGLTASAGAALAVDRRLFTQLGGFDPLYLPGRLEDLDFALRGYLAGYHACYVPESVMYHRGMATFGEVFGQEGCDLLALRNTLLLQWKNLRHPAHLARQLVGLPARLVLDVLRAPWVPAARRWMFARAFVGALGRLGQLYASSGAASSNLAVEREFFHRFHPHRMVESDVLQSELEGAIEPLAGLPPDHGLEATGQGVRWREATCDDSREDLPQCVSSELLSTVVASDEPESPLSQCDALQG